MKKIVKIQGSKWITSKSRFDNKNLKFISKDVLRTKLVKKSSKRLESIKAAHKSEKPDSTRMEDYLEVISELVDMKGYATTLDISRYMNVSAPSATTVSYTHLTLPTTPYV